MKRALRRDGPRPSSSTTRMAILVGWAACLLGGTCVSDKATSDDQPVPTVHLDVLESAEQRFSVVGSISRTAQTTLATIDFTDNAATQLNTINTIFLQPFSIFNEVINKLANVCPAAPTGYLGF